MIENHPPARPVYSRDHASARVPDQRERRAQARREAEALFAPKPAVTENPVTSPAKLARVLPAAPAAKQDASIRPEPVLAKTIPAAHAARIRSWKRYGMTVSQIAEVCGADIGEIERLLRQV